MNYKILTLLIIINSTAFSQIIRCRTEAEVPSTTPDYQFIDNNDGTVTDKKTSLMWQRCELGRSGSQCENGTFDELTWKEALEQAQANNLAGFNDWRVPNIKELGSIVEERCFHPALNSNVFPNSTTFPSSFWSSTPQTYPADTAIYININSGEVSSFTFRDATNLVRLVRDN